MEIKNPNVKKIKGKKTVVQEKNRINKSLSLIRIKPCLANETTINPAKVKNITCAID